ncbi:glutamyl-tRNA reductase [Reichenbachiella agarivorans]|uniref:Glutamyl-tRNA reductase n=1 Tax=Reichenbachiella agarivorans TaxID=2979464 RepID=A0ABY6CRV0_9BACT|nr:glutamyl-tRNA reductase [Reichenbachiella agarivorans]UXP33247.1 glutamyl-tRNA reductase [Reichenbachiella agarivorans]
MHNQFKAVGLSYKKTPLEIRELFSMDQEAIKAFLRLLGDYAEISEALVVSTCNRTEVYYSSPNDQFENIVKLICIAKGVNDTQDFSSYFINYPLHEEAIQHLFDVALGLEAQVVGDLQIINQVKNAYQWSADENMAGPFVHRLLHTIFFTNKRVVQETAFRDGAASVSYATVELIDELTAAIDTPKILVLGLGEIGEDVAKNLERIQNKEVFVCNRSIEKAQALSEEFGYQVIDFSDYAQAVKNADVIISSIHVTEPIITKSIFENNKVLSHKYLFDLSVPRSIEQDIEQVNGLLLYNIDNIQAKASQALERRLAAIPQVKTIITEAIDEFGSWSQEMEVSPVINKLKNALEDIRKNEIARHLKKVSEEESELIDKVTKSMMQKIIKLPVLQLKAACKRGEADSLIEVLNDLFNLEQQAETIKK